MPFQRSIIERCPRRYEESITLCTHHPSMGGYIYVCSSSSTMYQQHSNVKILEWQQQQQQCFLCNEKQLLNGGAGFRAIFIITFHSSQQWANILIESITLISFQQLHKHYIIIAALGRKNTIISPDRSSKIVLYNFIKRLF